jgi:hypothetical protein
MFLLRLPGRKCTVASIFLAISLLVTIGNALGAVTSISGANGLTVSVNSLGSYSILVESPAWQFGGNIGVPLANVTAQQGADAMGPYAEIVFDYSLDAPRHAGIRAYLNHMAVLFSTTYNGPAANIAPFPALTQYPQNLDHVTFGGMFVLASFPGFAPESPWVFFDASANTFIVSAAANFMTSQISFDASNAISSGISSQIAGFPAGFAHQTLLLIDHGINNAFDAWGQMLTDKQGKVRPANDADTVLNSLGYWTDNGASYYYNQKPSTSYQDTLLDVKSDFDRNGVPMGYMQLDSWFYPKGPNAEWWDGSDGIYQYDGAPALFSPSLAGFQTALGVPLVTHARWIDASSPYRQQYAISGNVATDPQYWADISNYLSVSGAVVYEQDWLGSNAQADFNLTDPDAFLRNMSAAMANRGLNMQYCMATAQHFLESSKFSNLTTARVSQDRFGSTRWTSFLFGSRIASALGIYPFTDVFMSSETDNMLLATLSAGPVGIGDPIGALNTQNIFRAIRRDGLIVKPDAPLVPIDSAYLSNFADPAAPMIASTFTDFGGLKAYYVFLYNQGSPAPAAVMPSDLGITSPAYVYNYYTDSGRVVNPGDNFAEAMDAAGRWYYIVAPIGLSGIAVLGDKGQFVSLGRKRVTQLEDDGSVQLSVAFAAGEKRRLIHGYSPTLPRVHAQIGTVSLVRYDPTTQRFAFEVSPAPGLTATVLIAQTGNQSAGNTRR